VSQSTDENWGKKYDDDCDDDDDDDDDGDDDDDNDDDDDKREDYRWLIQVEMQNNMLQLLCSSSQTHCVIVNLSCYQLGLLPCIFD
jgi:hypothetical protein